MPRPPPLFSGPPVGFDQPFEMLDACHARMERSLALLERLGVHLEAHLAGSGVDAQAREAATDVLRYFDIAAPLHHEDEERHVFPRLRDAGQAAMAARLRGEHQVMEREWAALRPDLVAVQAGTLAPGALAEARARWRAFATLYRDHLAAEEALAFPVARAGLPEQVAATMGAEMAGRRGVSPPRPDPAAGSVA